MEPGVFLWDKTGGTRKTSEKKIEITGGFQKMFGEMRRKKQALPLEACEKILERGTSGVLALEGEEGYPYAVPLSYYYEKGKIFFHCGKRGYKIEALKRNEKVSFCVIDQD